MRIKSYLSSILFGCLIFNSCQNSDAISPDIRIISPTQNQVLPLSQDLLIEADISDDIGLHSYTIELESQEGIKLFKEKVHIEESAHTLMYRLDLTQLDDTAVKIELEAKDTQGNSSKKEVWVNVEW